MSGRLLCDFGMMRVGTVYEKSVTGWIPYLPARYRLGLGRRSGLLINSVFVSAQLSATPILMPRATGLIAVPGGIRLSDLLAALRRGPRRIDLLDLSSLTVDDVDAVPEAGGLKGRTVRALAAPAWMSASQSDGLRRIVGARAIIDPAPTLAPHRPMPEGDPSELRALVSGAVARHPELAPPARYAEAAALAEAYLDVDRATQALAILAPGLAAGDAYCTRVAATAADQLGAPRAALAACDAALATGTEKAWTLAKRAQILHMSGHSAAAILGLDDVLRNAPTNRFALALLAFAYVHCGQTDAADAVVARLAEVDPEGRDTLFARAHARSAANAGHGTSGQRSRGRRGEERALWHALLEKHPTDQVGLRRLAELERASNPWGRAWASTYLRVVDESSPASGEGRKLARLVAEHPTQIAFSAGGFTGVAWIGLGAFGALPPMSAGWPIAAAGVVGASAFGFLRSRIPQRARRAAGALGGSGRGVWIGWLACITVGIALLASGSVILRPDKSCRGRISGTCAPVIPRPRIPSIVIPPVVIPTFPAPPVFTGPVRLPSFPAFPSFPVPHAP